MNSLWKNFSKEELSTIVSSSTTYKEILQKIGYKPVGANNCKVREFCNLYNIDYSHLTQGKKEDLTGKTFGYLKVIKEDLNKNNTKSQNTYWFCECQACNKHTIKSICAADLKRGSVTNCGCIKRERIIKQNHNNFTDLSGQKYNYLSVIKPIFNGDNFTNKYLCKCECGKIVEVFRQNLISGSTASCGCKNMSNGEINTERALKELNILFKQQYSFNDLYGDCNLLKFDFAIFDNANNLIALIECQGRQHFEAIDYFGGETQFAQQQKYDKKKEQYCKEHNILLIKIPYTDYNKINKEYIQYSLRHGKIDTWRADKRPEDCGWEQIVR